MTRYAHKRWPAYQDWIRHQPCALAVSAYHECAGVMEVAHLDTRGKGAWDVANVVPLCSKEHKRQTHMGIGSWFWNVLNEHGVNPWEDAVMYLHRFLDEQDRAA